MSEIPGDIINSAIQTYYEVNTDPVHAIAKAIWAERQRCAKIADDNEGSHDDQYGQGWNSACFRISQAILNQTEE